MICYMYAVVIDMLSLFFVYVATDMSPKNIKGITDRATSQKAKAYIYGVKEIRKLASVKETNIYVEKYMAYKPKDEKTYWNVINSSMTRLFRVTLFVLYLYMVWSFIIN